MSAKKDQFASLFASSLKPKSAAASNSNLSLSERSKLQSSTNSLPLNGNVTTSSNQWNGLDLLARSSVTPKSATSKSSSSDLFEGFDVVNKNISSNGTGKSDGDLFDTFPTHKSSPSGNNRAVLNSTGNLQDDFNIFYPGSSTKTQQMSNAKKTQELDDLFAVFDKPAPPTLNHTPIEIAPSSRTNSSAFNDPIPQRPSRPRQQTPPTTQAVSKQDQYDEALAQLMEMGFSLDQSKSALRQTDTGIDIEQAICVLMNAAHNKRPTQSNGGRPDYIQGFSKLVSSTTSKVMNSKYVNELFSGPQGVAGSRRSPDNINNGRPAWMKDQERYKAQATMKYEVDQDHPEFDQTMVQRVRLSEKRNEKYKFQEEEMVQQSQSRNRRRVPEPGPRPEVKQGQQQQTRAQQQQQQLQPEMVDLFTPEPVVDLFTPEPVVDLFSNHEPQQTSTINRPTVPISSTQLSFFQDSRTQGTAAFKQGDFTLALQHYETALSSLPDRHLLRIIGFSNCITVLLKNGQNKRALSYADSALEIIGREKGKGEYVEGKEIFTFWYKISSKRAEALEHLEHFQQALDQYLVLVENGQTGKLILEGKRRCEMVLKPKSTTKDKPQPSTKPQPGPRPAKIPTKAPVKPFTNSTVERVKASNLAESQLESQKSELLEEVQSQVTNWSTMPTPNLRQLLSTLQTILPPSIQWITVNSSELVMPKRVKMTYLKAVAKCHPDKIPRDADVKTRMVCEAVFVELSKAWELFRAENGM